MSSESDRLRRAALIAAPPLLLASTYLVFNAGAALWGPRLGNLPGLAFYWGFWCLLFSLWAVGGGGLRAMFRRPTTPVGQPAWLGWLLLLLPIVSGLALYYGETWAQATVAIVLLSLPIALVNGTLEEVLWRGAYTRAFPRHPLWGYLYPSVGFGFWHLAPLSIQGPFSWGEALFVALGGTAFGLCWGWVAWRTGSIRWAVASHILLNIVLLPAVAIVG